MTLKAKLFSPKTLSVIIGGLILCFWAFFNHYPLLYSDTGSFIASGAEKGFNSARVYYGLLIRQISMRETLFLVVFAQGLIVSWLIHTVVEQFGTVTNRLIWSQLIVILLTVFTGVSFHVSQIMADIFTAVSSLCLLLILFGKNLPKAALIFICILFYYSNICHQTHPVIMLLTLAVTGLFFFLRRKNIASLFRWKRYFLALGISAASWLTLPTANLVYLDKFIYSENTFMYRMSGLIEMGIMHLYLEEHCYERNYPLCQYERDTKGGMYNFLWDENSPANLNGGWQAHKAEYTQLMNDIFSEPKYVKLFIRKSIEAAFQQFFSFESGETTSFSQGSAPYGACDWHFHADMRGFVNSKQNLKQLDFASLNQRQLMFVFLSLFILLGVILSTATTETNQTFRMIIITLIVILFVNAFMCSVFSIVVDRFQSRVVWLIPLFAMVIISNKFSNSGFINRIAERFKS
jgi:hypothetical protein